MGKKPEELAREKIDKKLRALGWQIMAYKDISDTSTLVKHAVEE